MTLRDMELRTARALDARALKYEREVAGILTEALKEMRSEMTVIYERYAVDGKLALADMVNYNRLAKLEDEILKTMDTATRKSVGVFSKMRPEMYSESFLHYAWSIDEASGISLKWGTLNMDAILASLDNRIYQLAVKSYTQDARIRILREINQGLVQGKSYQTMARGLKDQINATQYQAMRILRTEGQTAQTAGQDAAYLRAQDQGIELDVIWDATLDDKTRDSHGAMDGVAREDGLFTLPGGEQTPYPCWEGLSAGERIQCRCRLRGQIEGYAPQLRRDRERGVMPYQTYSEWVKGR